MIGVLIIRESYYLGSILGIPHFPEPPHMSYELVMSQQDADEQLLWMWGDIFTSASDFLWTLVCTNECGARRALEKQRDSGLRFRIWAAP